MKLYFAKGACSLSIRITINELKIACEFESVNLKTKITENGSNFLTINSKGSVPVLITTENTTLTENSAILQFLADGNQGEALLPLVGDFKRYKVLEWLSYVSSDVHKSCGPLFNPIVPDKEKNEIFIPALKNKLKFIDEHLQDHTYLASDAFTLADCYLFVVLRWMPSLKIDLADFPNLSGYFNKLKVRPSIAKSLADEGIV